MTTATKIKFIAAILIIIAVVSGLTWLYFNKEKPLPAPPSIQVMPQTLTTHTETIREIAVAPAAPGNIMQFTEREGKQFVVINGKEYQLAVQPGAPNVKIGESGQIVMETQTIAKVDITDMVTAEVKDKVAIANAQAKADYEKKANKVKIQNTVEKIAIAVLGVGAGYVTGKAIAK